MTDFEFNCKTFTNRLMAYANRRHYLAVEEAHVRMIRREAAREYRNLRIEKGLYAALLTVSVIGIAVATWFLASIGAG